MIMTARSKIFLLNIQGNGKNVNGKQKNGSGIVNLKMV